MKKGQIFGFSVIVLIVGLTAMFLTSCGAKATKGVTSVGEIVYMEGTVMVNGSPVEIGDVATHGDVIVTGSNSYVEVQFGDKRIFRASENATLTLDSGEKTLQLKAGALSVVQSKAKFFFFDKPWVVKTPTTIAAVRGTVYYVKVESDDSTYFCLCNGKIRLKDAVDGKVKDLEAIHHSAVRLIRQPDGSIAYEDAAMLFHTDDDMESLADRISEVIDWEVVG